MLDRSTLFPPVKLGYYPHFYGFTHEAIGQFHSSCQLESSVLFLSTPHFLFHLVFSCLSHFQLILSFHIFPTSLQSLLQLIRNLVVAHFGIVATTYLIYNINTLSLFLFYYQFNSILVILMPKSPTKKKINK